MKIYTLVFSPIEVNTYLLADDDNNCAIIDCGCYTAKEFRQLESFIEEKKLKPVLLLNTHCHLDHMFGNKSMLERFKLKSHWSSFDDMNRVNAPSHAILFGLSMNEPPEPERYVEDNEFVSFGDEELQALFVPGHTSGSLAWYSCKHGCVFTGDALFSGSIGRTDLEGGDYDTLIKSIKTKLFTLPEDTVVYPGHGRQTSIGREMKTNPFFS